MKKGFSLGGWLAHSSRASRLPDLGRRELNVLEALWEHAPLSTQSVHTHMPAGGISLSTVQSTLERLHRKQLVERSKSGRSYIYNATLSRQQIISRLMHDIADSLTDGDSAPMVSGFLDYLTDEDDLPLDPKRRRR